MHMRSCIIVILTRPSTQLSEVPPLSKISDLNIERSEYVLYLFYLFETYKLVVWFLKYKWFQSYEFHCLVKEDNKLSGLF